MWEWIREANRRGEGVGDADLREMLDVLALENLLERRDAARRGRAALAARSRSAAGAPARDFAPRRRAARADRARRAGTVRDTPGGLGARAASVIVYGRNAVREALRGRRGGDGRDDPGDTRRRARAVARPGSARIARRGDEIERLRLARAPGRLRRARAATPTSGAELLAVEEPLIVALDEVQDPQNLGAICRTAECVGASGVVICERRAAEVTPAVCRASAGAVEHLRIARARNLADFLRGARGRLLELRRRGRRRAPSPYAEPDYAAAAW